MTSSFLEAIEDKVRDVAATWEESKRSSEYTGPPKLESGYYSSGRMQGFGSDSTSHCSSSGDGLSLIHI